MTAVHLLMLFVTAAQSLERSSPWSILSLHSFMTATPWELWQILLCVACIHRKHCPASPMSSLAAFRWTDRNTHRGSNPPSMMNSFSFNAEGHGSPKTNLALKLRITLNIGFSGGVAVGSRISAIHIRGGAIAPPMCPAHHQQQEDGRPPQHLTAKWRLRLVMFLLLLLRPSCCHPVAETLKQNLDVPLLSCHCTKGKGFTTQSDCSNSVTKTSWLI